MMMIKVQPIPQSITPPFSPQIFANLSIDFQDSQIRKSGSVRKNSMPAVGKGEIFCHEQSLLFP